MGARRTHGRGSRAGDRRSRLAIAATLALLLAAAVIATAARAQDPVPLPVDPANPTAPGGPIDQNIDAGENTEDLPGGGVPDTDYTPHYKDSDLWHQVGGAEYPTTDLVDSSPTDFSDGLFAVSFRSTGRGFVGGQSCHDPQGDVPEPGSEEFGQCKPVLYAYSNTLQFGERWSKVDLPGSDQQGFVGAIAWISATKALAVGGTGTYQRRERELSEAQIEQCRQEGTDASAQDPGAAVRPPTISTDNSDLVPPTVVKDQGSVKANDLRAECANRLREQNDRETGAGEPRVWVYDASRSANDGWRELADEDLPAGMTALSAIDCDPEAGVEFCFAGGLGQLSQWDTTAGGGSFTKRYDRNSPASDVHNRPGLRYRVREIRFVPLVKANDRLAYAVTSGCCPGDGLGEASPERGGRVLAYGRRVAAFPPKLYVRRFADSTGGNSGAGQENGGRGWGTNGIGNSAAPFWEFEGATNRLDPRRDIPDSFYSFTVAASAVSGVASTGRGFSLVASPGGPESDGEQSLISQPFCVRDNGIWEPTEGTATGFSTTDYDAVVELTRRHWFSSARLVAGDGDLDRSSLEVQSGPLGASLDPGYRWIGGPSDVRMNQQSAASNAFAGNSCEASLEDHRGDSVPDWVVGELRGARASGLGAPGLIYGNNLRPPIQPGTIDSPCTGGGGGTLGCSGPDTARLTDPDYRPTDPDRLSAWLASKYLRLPSYGLAEIDVVGDSGQGWAVGEHGALLRLDESSLRQNQAAEPTPPALGSRRSIEAPDASPYGDMIPGSAGSPAAVPALGTRETLELDEPELIGWGSPNPAVPHTLSKGTAQWPREMVMSRDGSEGWAVGARRSKQRTTLIHFDGESWSHCELTGISGQVAPDPACASLRDLPAYIHKTQGANASSKPQPAQLLSLARVPYENDSDPSNDDEFEVVALGTNYRERDTDPEVAVMARYRDGRWSLVPGSERAAVNLNAGDGAQGFDLPAQIAFATPSEGWIRGGTNANLYHYDGERWALCTTEAAPECGLTEHTGFASYVGLPPRVSSVGERSFMFGSRLISDGNTSTYYPLVLSKAPGEPWSAEAADGALDPGFGQSPSPAIQGHVGALVIVPRAGGAGFEGFATGDFQTEAVGRTSLLRLTGTGWEPYDDAGPIADALAFSQGASPTSAVLGQSGFQPTRGLDRTVAAAYRDAQGRARFVLGSGGRQGRIFAFEPERERWGIVNGVTPDLGAYAYGSAEPLALAPDNQGGAWVATVANFSDGPPYFFRFTDHRPEPVFSEAPSPQDTASPAFTSLAGSPGGSVWLGTNTNTLYRYARGIGWDRVRIPGWDQGRVVTRPSEVRAIALGSDGGGVVVGREGRIAEISPGGAQVGLDAAAGQTLCSVDPAPPCGTGHTLRAAAVAPDGSAIVAGDNLALLWRPPGGEFRAVTKPAAALSAAIMGVSMPTSEVAYLATDSGLVFRGELAGAGWSWSAQPENVNALGDPINLDDRGGSIPLRAIAVNAEGRGYAVGDRGLILHRQGDGATVPWTRLPPRQRDSFTSVVMGANGSSSALIGGRSGVLLFAQGPNVSVSRPGDWVHSLEQYGVGEQTGPVVGLALLPGPAQGQSEAWAAIGSKEGDPTAPDVGTAIHTTGTNRLFHFASDPTESLLSGGAVGAPIADTPAPRPGELSFAALGKTHCDQARRHDNCAVWSQSTLHEELLAREVIARISGRAAAPGGPAFALFTGDALESPGRPDESDTGAARYRRWAEQVADPLARAGVPLFGALGSRDLSRLEGGGVRAPDVAGAGESGTWRAAMAQAPAPWGAGPDAEAGGLTAVSVPGSANSRRTREGAATHYAFDLVSGEQKRFRVIFADTSGGNVGGSPEGQPSEPTGQQAWLQQMLCFEGGSDPNGPCTRREGEPAIVVSTTPTYSAGPRQGETQTDAALMENLLLQGEATALISGRIGHNALSYTCAPGLHHPQPGQPYPAGPPEQGSEGCGQLDPPTNPTGQLQETVDQAVNEIQGNAGATGLVANVTAASAGGPLATEGSGGASEGFWHGYSVVRIPADGDPRELIVEQRPVLDFAQIQASSHVVRPSKTVELHGFGREPVGVASPQVGAGQVSIAPQVERFDEISTPAITHRYDLLVADAGRPWVPKQGETEDACDPYDCLDPSVGTVNGQSGQVKAGKGNYPRTFAIAALSVGELSATYPLVFEPRASYRSPAPPPPVPVAVPAPPPPPAAAPPTSPTVNLPSAPVLPVLTAQALAPPPIPPSPPTFASQAPLDTNISPAALNVMPPTAVTQPPTPPVNPAPPGGARKEARQRQAAAQKSGADSDQEGSESQIDTADSPSSPPGAEMTRHDFTAVAERGQPSAWVRDALLGGGLGIAALVLALGLRTARPTPRRREPEIPAPAWARRRGR